MLEHVLGRSTVGSKNCNDDTRTNGSVFYLSAKLSCPITDHFDDNLKFLVARGGCDGKGVVFVFGNRWNSNRDVPTQNFQIFNLAAGSDSTHHSLSWSEIK